jgi:hypothetical protein
VEGVRVGELGLSHGVAPNGRGPTHQVTAVKIVPGVNPLPRLLVLAQPRIKPPADPGPVQVDKLLAIDPDTGDGRQTLVQAHQHREVRVRQKDGLHAGQPGQRH